MKRIVLFIALFIWTTSVMNAKDNIKAIDTEDNIDQNITEKQLATFLQDNTTSCFTSTMLKEEIPFLTFKSYYNGQRQKLQIGIAKHFGDFARGSKPGDVIFRKLGAVGSKQAHNFIFYMPGNYNDGDSYINFGDAEYPHTMRIFNNGTVTVGYSEAVNKGENSFAMAVNGNVGIGTISPEAALDVRGAIMATEVRISARTADFVFEDTYDLKDLDQVKEFIDKNKHLPDVPSAKKMQQDKMDIAKMNQILLQKIEELTLYTIQLNEQIKSLQSTLKKSN